MEDMIMNTVLAFLLAFLLGKGEAKAQDGQITDKPIEARKERIRDVEVYSRAEFQALVLGKTEEQIVQLLGKPDQVLYFGGLSVGVCLGRDLSCYRIRIRDLASQDRVVPVCIAINAWTGVCDGIAIDSNQLSFFGP
jgi:hypothetical protein